MLAITEYATLDIQSALGSGATAGSSVDTGGTASLGNASGNAGSSGSVSYRGEENIYGNFKLHVNGLRSDLVDGATHVSVSLPCDGGEYADAGITLCGQTGYVTALTYSAEFDWLLLPAASSDSEQDSYPDDLFNATYSGQNGVIVLSGSNTDGTGAGLFYAENLNSTSVYTNIKARLTYR